MKKTLIIASTLIITAFASNASEVAKNSNEYPAPAVVSVATLETVVEKLNHSAIEILEKDARKSIEEDTTYSMTFLAEVRNPHHRESNAFYANNAISVLLPNLSR